MNIEELKYQILQQFGFPPTPEQAQALDVFVQFMTDSNPHAVMILRGSAGTGKTSLSGAIVRTLCAVRQKVMLLAPTGRAAKVFSLNSGMPAIPFIAASIAKRRLPEWMDSSISMIISILIRFFMVDEASMIANPVLFSLFGVLIFQMVSSSIYRSADDQLAELRILTSSATLDWASEDGGGGYEVLSDGNLQPRLGAAPGWRKRWPTVLPTAVLLS